ncbi:MAG: hypothetical protein UHD04_03825, partial [Muribaculaceae bacterium]|nr:hypothetical protein [Muribaculaceae bacterium]
ESGVDKEWSGDLYFDNLEFNKWDNSATRTAKLDDVTIPSGIEDVVIDNNSPAEYFNLQGMKVARPSKGIFIKRQGNKTSKVVL